MKKVLLLVALSVFALMGRAIAGDNTLDVPVFDLKDLKPGLKGTARTVIRGTTIEEFDVEVIELIPDGGFDGGPLILAHFTGPVVDHSNGIAGGYSGSPVYIDGKLLGAVSAAIPFTDTHVGGVTPISSMMAALPDIDEPDYLDNTVLPETENSGIPIDEDGNVISYVDSLQDAIAFNEAARRDGRHEYEAVLATTPVYVSGINHKVFSLYEDQMRTMLGSNLELIEKPGGSGAGDGLFLRQDSDGNGLLLDEDRPGPPLVGGDAVAASLVTGVQEDDDKSFAAYLTLKQAAEEAAPVPPAGADRSGEGGSGVGIERGGRQRPATSWTVGARARCVYTPARAGDGHGPRGVGGPLGRRGPRAPRELDRHRREHGRDPRCGSRRR